MNKLKVLLSLVVVLLMTGCQNSSFINTLGSKELPSTGEMQTKQIKLSQGLENLVVNNGLNVEYTQGKDCKATVSGPADAIALLEVLDRGDDLSISLKHNYVDSKGIVKISVVAPSISDFTATTSASIRFVGGLKADKVDLQASTSATIEASSITAREVTAVSSTSADMTLSGIVAKTVKAGVSTSATITLAGEATNVEFTASTSGTIDAKGLKADSGEAVATTSGSIDCAILNPEITETTSGSVTNAAQANAQ